MSIRSLFPDIRPSLNLDFANTRALDPRVTFARASTAAYYDGKTTHKAEENLILYSQEFNAWNNLDSSLTANTDIAPDGTQTADKLVPNGTNTRHISYLATPYITNNLPYTYSAYIKAAGYNFAQLGLFLNSGGVDAYIIVDLTNGTVTQSAGNTGVRGTFSFSVQSVGNGWYRAIITCGNVTGMLTAQGIILGASNSGTPSLAAAGSPTFSGDGTSGILIWGAQLEQRSSVTTYTPTVASRITRYAPTLLTAPVGSPRFDHNPTTGESLGLLIEEQRTNLLNYSSNFADSVWNKNYTTTYRSTVESNAAVAPNGTLTAARIYRTIGQGSGAIGVLRVDNSGASGQSYSTSVYLKYSGYSTNSRYVILVSSDASSGTYETQFDILAGTIVSNGSSNTSSITPVGNGWYRCTVSALTQSTFRYVWIKNDFSVDEGSGFLIWGAQFESGLFPTSYIPTTTSQVTRSADAASMTGTNFSSWFDQEKGSLYLETQALSSTSAINRRLLFLSSLDDTYAVELNFGAGTNSIVASRRGLGANVLSMINNPAKVAFAWDMLGSSLSIDAQAVNSTSGSSTPRNFSALQFGKVEYPLPDGTAGNIYMKKIAYYPKKLTNSQLQALTTP